MMTRSHTQFVLAAAFVLAAVVPAIAQEKPPATRIPASVEVTISRFQGTKKVSSQPFVMMPTAGGGGNAGYASVRVGVDVPVGTTTTTRPAEGGREGSTTTQPSYRSVGTNMDCRVTPLADGRFDVQVSVTDSSIFSPDGSAQSARPADPQAFRTFQASNTLTMRDGQKMLLTTATDKVTGEVLMIEVTFNLIK